eukprot:TRINITY_DN7965_c0_g1_i3.p2 TRINITY_DN7965_c0_g1~~TRINITY_DN7965_c0_g1_i3.p2  ORF type:complete len:116 (-),score=39.96 TRINITY_DN7965_c0_g1_i3:96-443(-)
MTAYLPHELLGSWAPPREVPVTTLSIFDGTPDSLRTWESLRAAKSTTTPSTTSRRLSPQPQQKQQQQQQQQSAADDDNSPREGLSLIHISEPTRLLSISYAVFCLKKKKKNTIPT